MTVSISGRYASKWQLPIESPVLRKVLADKVRLGASVPQDLAVEIVNDLPENFELRPWYQGSLSKQQLTQAVSSGAGYPALILVRDAVKETPNSNTVTSNKETPVFVDSGPYVPSSFNLSNPSNFA